jgi:hypothetical protein
MRRVPFLLSATVALLLALAACSGSSGGATIPAERAPFTVPATAPSAGMPGAQPPSPGTTAAAPTGVPVRTCPAPTAPAAQVRVVAQDITLRARPATGATQIAAIPNGQVLVVLDIGEHLWLLLQCGELIGWGLCDNGRHGDARIVWLTV